MKFLQSFAKFYRELLIASFANWLCITLVKLGLGVQPLIAVSTGEMMLTPRFI